MNAIEQILGSLSAQDVAWRMGWALVHFVWQGAGVAVITAVALRLLKNRSPNARYATACAAMLLLAALPVATAMLVGGSPIAAFSPEPVEFGDRPVGTSVRPEVYTPGVPAPVGPPPSPVPAQKARPSSVSPEPPAGPDVSLCTRAADALEPYLPHLVTAWIAGVLMLSIWRADGCASAGCEHAGSNRPMSPSRPRWPHSPDAWASRGPSGC